MYQQSEKNLLNSSISSTCPHNMVNFGPLVTEIGLGVRSPQQISTGFASCLRYCSDVTHQRPTKLCIMLVHLLGWYTIYTFSGGLVLTEFCQVQNSLYFQVLRSPILAALLHGCQAAGVSQTLPHGQGMELRNFRRWHHLYSAGRPSRWALDHILVITWRIRQHSFDYFINSKMPT